MRCHSLAPATGATHAPLNLSGESRLREGRNKFPGNPDVGEDRNVFSRGNPVIGEGEINYFQSIGVSEVKKTPDQSALQSPLKPKPRPKQTRRSGIQLFCHRRGGR